MVKPRVVVTGMGIVSSIGGTREEFSNSLRQGRCGIDYLKSTAPPPIPVNIGAQIAGFSFLTALDQQQRRGIPGDMIEKARYTALRSPLAIQASVIAALEAWHQARVYERPTRSDRLGVIAAGSNLSQGYQYGVWTKFQHSPEYLNPRYALHYMDTDHIAAVSEIFHIQGEGFTVGGASASGNAAIIKAYQSIRLGIVDVCLVIGAMTDLSSMELMGFYNLGAMGGKKFREQPQKACRPFDQDHEGFIYGQAAGCLVLESLAFAKQQGIPLLVELAGGALLLDGNRLSNPNVQGEVRAMQAALDQAGIKPGDVDYLNTHGTSSPLGDETEIKAIKEVFKKNISHLWLNSTKGLTGHCLTAAGVIESIAAIIQMQEGFIHPNLNLEQPIDDECKFSRHQAIETLIHTAMNNSFGFGGINTSVIFKKPVH
jgi:malonyl-ACP decarboxylase